MAKAPGKSHREGISLIEIMRRFPDDATAEAWFIKRRWPNGITCPHCGSDNVQTGAKHKTMPFRCREKECARRFSAKTGTVMEGSKLGFQVWMVATYQLSTSLKSVSSMKLHRDLEINQRSAWFLAHRLRVALAQKDEAFAGPVEADETYFGGKRKNMSNAKRKELAGTGRGAVGKEAVVGVKDRESNKVAARHVQGTDTPHVAGFVAEKARLGAKAYTDEASVYYALDAFFDHESVNHSAGEYVREQAHVNGMESFWSMMKRAHTGTFHKFSPKHLDRYVQEFAARHNLREADTIDIMGAVADGGVGKRLRYRELIADNGLSSPEISNRCCIGAPNLGQCFVQQRLIPDRRNSPMPTHCNPDLFGFAPVEDRSVVAAFDGGTMTSDAGALLLGATDRAVGLIDRLAACFVDHRDRTLIEHELRTLVGQRVLGIALGYEDLIDHDTLRHDPVMAVLAGKLQAKRRDCAPLAGKSTLNRLELSTAQPGPYHKIGHRPAAVEALFVQQFVAAQRTPPAQIVLDLDATDDPLHGHQEGRFFHGYYDAYCYLPLYIFCGRHLLAAKLRRANIDASAGAVEEVARIVRQLRRHWPHVRILLRADSGFAREALMAWCEANGVDYLFGLARNPRLVAALEAEQAAARAEAEAKGRPARRYKDFLWSTRDSWSRRRRVVGKAEWTGDKANPRFVVTSLRPEEARSRRLYETLYCARGEMENRIKECQLDLFADRTSARTMRANQLRLWFASMAYVLLCALRRIGLAHTRFARASCGSIRLKLLKIAALVRISVRRIKFAMASGCPYQSEFQAAHARLSAAAA